MSWVPVCRRGDIPTDRGWPVRVGDRNIAVFDLDGELHAIDNVCLHVGNPLDDGFRRGHYLTCPWHGWRYDLRTGEHMTVFGRRPGLSTYPVRIEDDTVYVEVD